MNTPKHTPTPWTNTPMQDTIWANDGETLVCKIADLPWIDGKSQWQVEGANAAFIVRAVNSHEDLIGALQTIADAGESGLLSIATMDAVKEVARLAIALAERN